MNFKQLLFLPLAALALFMAACSGGSEESHDGDNHDNDGDETSMVDDQPEPEPETPSLSPPSTGPSMEEAGFFVKFKTQPEISTETIDTDIGPVEMVYYMHEESQEKVYMVAYSDYDAEAIAGSDPMALLQNAQDGATQSLGISNLTVNESISMGGNPGRHFEGSSASGYNAAYKLYMVENRLYQIGILQMNDPISQSDIDGFINTFKLL